jgi:hypothetical protein
MSVTIENIDWALLRQQKQFLLTVCDTVKFGIDDAEGLINLLDNLQDKAVEQGYDKSIVYGQETALETMIKINALLDGDNIIIDDYGQNVHKLFERDGVIGYSVKEKLYTLMNNFQKFKGGEDWILYTKSNISL